MMRVGVLGGSFNPAHDGHRYISLIALRRLGLHQVWWMVSPQNPLKGRDDMAPFAERKRSAERAARHPRIRVTDIERRLGTVYTAETLSKLKARSRGIKYVWLMGADNLVQISQWKDWQRIFRTMPIAVFARPPYSRQTGAVLAARCFAKARLRETHARGLVDRVPPAWVYFHSKPHAGSATSIRAQRASGSAPAPTEALCKRA